MWCSLETTLTQAVSDTTREDDLLILLHRTEPNAFVRELSEKVSADMYAVPHPSSSSKAVLKAAATTRRSLRWLLVLLTRGRGAVLGGVVKDVPQAAASSAKGSPSQSPPSTERGSPTIPGPLLQWLCSFFSNSDTTARDPNAYRTLLLVRLIFQLLLLSPQHRTAVATAVQMCPRKPPDMCRSVLDVVRLTMLQEVINLASGESMPPRPGLLGSRALPSLHRWYVIDASTEDYCDASRLLLPTKGSVYSCIGSSSKCKNFFVGGATGVRFTLLLKTEEMTPSQMVHITAASRHLHDTGAFSLHGDDHAASRRTTFATQEYALKLLEDVRTYTTSGSASASEASRHTLSGLSYKAHSHRVVEATASAAIRSASQLCIGQPDAVPIFLGEVLVIFQNVVQAVRHVEAPRTFLVKPVGQLVNEDHQTSSPREMSTAAVDSVLVWTSQPPNNNNANTTTTPHFSCDLVLSCLHFLTYHLVDAADIHHHFELWFSSPCWHAWTHTPSFPLSLLRFFLLHGAKISTAAPMLLPIVSPRVLHAFALSPHTTFKMLQRVLPSLISPDSFVDVFLRIIYITTCVRALEHPALKVDLTNLSALFPDPFHGLLLESFFDLRVFPAADAKDEADVLDVAMAPRTAWESFVTSHWKDVPAWQKVQSVALPVNPGETISDPTAPGVKSEVAATCVLPLLETFFGALLPDLDDTHAPDVARLIPHLLFSHHTSSSAVQSALLRYAQDLAVVCPSALFHVQAELLDALQQSYLARTSVPISYALRAACAAMLTTSVSSLRGQQTQQRQRNIVHCFDVMHDLLFESSVTSPSPAGDGDDGRDSSVERFLSAAMISMTSMSVVVPELHDRCAVALLTVSRASPAESPCAETAAMLKHMTRAPTLARAVIAQLPSHSVKRKVHGHESNFPFDALKLGMVDK